jgi:hypothetical protein
MRLLPLLGSMKKELPIISDDLLKLIQQVKANYIEPVQNASEESSETFQLCLFFCFRLWL